VKLPAPRSFKRLLPKTLFGRSLLIIVLPVAIMQIAVTWVFFDEHWNSVNSRLSEGLAGDVAWAVATLHDDPSPAGLALLSKRAEESLSLSIVLQPGRSLPTGRRASLIAST
jgi:two-component system osmolarity sensor histidine kinase EnvZ